MRIIEQTYYNDASIRYLGFVVFPYNIVDLEQLPGEFVDLDRFGKGLP